MSSVCLNANASMASSLFNHVQQVCDDNNNNNNIGITNHTGITVCVDAVSICLQSQAKPVILDLVKAAFVCFQGTFWI